MSDGAHLGVGAGRALDTILGGEPAPSKDEGMTPAEMRAWLEQPDTDGLTDGDGYSEAARRFGRLVLAYLDAHPEHREEPASDEYEFPDPNDYDNYRITRKGLFTLATEALPEDEREDAGGLTGFMVGWGVNAAKYAIGAPPSSNPALLTVDL